jgi:glycosyltransferase involved in cell wall biosynthesis
VLCLNDTGPFAAELEGVGVRVHLLHRRGEGPDYLAFRKAADFFRELSPDIVHTHNTQPFIDGGLGAILARVPVLIHTDHARDFPDKRRYMLAERVLSRFAEKVVGVSDHTGRNLVEFERIDPSRIITIHNGIEDPARRDVDAAAKRSELGIPPDAMLIGVGVRFTEQKGLEYLLRALPTVRERVPHVHLALAGYGPLEVELKEQAERLGLSDGIHFLGAREDMAEVLAALDVYALPSIWEGFPMVVLEAMAAGLPIVATRVGGVAEAVEHERTGLLVAPRDPERLAAALIRVLCDETLRHEYGSAARRFFEERFTAEAMSRNYAALYEECRFGRPGARARARASR